MIRKIFTVLLSALCIGCTVGALAACSGSETALEGEYETNYHRVFADECDSSMTIDGKLDEDVWQNKSYLTNVCSVPGLNNDATVRYTVHMTEKGLYVGSSVDDTTFYYNRVYSNSNSNWKIYIAPVGETVNNQAYVKTFQIDYGSIRSAQGARVSSAVWVDGELNSGNTSGASMEMFLAWDQLNIDVSGYKNGYPDQIKMYATYTIVLDSTGSTSRVLSTAFTSPSKPSMYYLFDNSGYLNTDKEGAVLGDAPTGYAKTAGWDIGKEDSVESVSDNVQIIWFRNAYSASWAAEVKITPVDDINDPGPKVGMIALRDTNNFRAFLLNAADSNLVESGEGRNFESCHMYGLTYYPSYTWTMTALGVDSSVDMDAYDDGCIMKVVKDGEKMYYFINGTFVYSEVCSYINGSVYAGLISVGFDAVFSDYRFTDYSGDAQGLAQELAGMARLSVENGVGGTAQTDTIAVRTGESATLRLNVWQGYELSSVTANGTDITQALREGADDNRSYLTDGSCVIGNITQDTTFAVNYEPLAQSKQVMLTIRDEESNPLAGRAIVYSESDPLLRYEVSVGASASRCVLPSDRGALRIIVITNSSGTLLSTLDMQQDAYTFAVGDPLIGGDYDYGTYSVSSSRNGWDYMFQSEGTVYADETANGTYAYFGAHFDDTAVIRMTINKSESAEQWLFAGIVMSNADGRAELGMLSSHLTKYVSGTRTDIAQRIFSNSLAGTQAASVTLVFVRREGKIRVYEEVGGTAEFRYELDDLLTGDAAYGLAVRANAAVDVEFSELSILTGAEAEAEIEENYTPEPPVDTAFIGGNYTFDEYSVESAQSGWDYSQATSDKIVTATQAANATYAYFADSYDDTAVIKMSIGKAASTEDWLFAGIVLSNASGKTEIGVMSNGLRKYDANGEQSVLQNDIFENSLYGTEEKAITLVFVRIGGVLRVYEEVGGVETLRYEGEDLMADATAYGLTIRAGKAVAVTFSELSILTGTDAEREIAEKYTPEEAFFGDVGSGVTVSESEGDISAQFAAIGSGAAAYFAQTGTAPHSAVAEVTIDSANTAWATIGFVMKSGENEAYFGLYANRFRVLLNGTPTYENNTAVFDARAHMAMTDVRIKMFRSGETICILEDSGSGYAVKVEMDFSEMFGASYVTGMFDGETSYGVGVRATNGQVTFSSIRYLVGDEAAAEIEMSLPFFGASANVTVSEENQSVTIPAVSSGYAYADFAETDSTQKAVILLTVNYSGNGWTVIGFTMASGGNKAYMGIYATRLRTELNGSDKSREQSGVFTADTRNGLADVQIMLIRSGNTLSFLEKIDGIWQVKKTDTFANLFHAESYSDGMFDGEVTYGVGVRATNGEATIAVNDYKTGDAAQTFIDQYLPEDPQTAN